jgi:hypothetical protein
MTGKPDCSTKKQKLFRQRGLAGIRMRDDREGAPVGWLSRGKVFVKEGPLKLVEGAC